jgi:ABC-type nitrate/sulfonate/bicarbonate transport system substrate-binding protein
MTNSNITSLEKQAADARIGDFLFSRCPVVPTTSALAGGLGLLDEVAATEPNMKMFIRQQQGDYLLEDPAPHRERYWMRHAGNLKAMWARSAGAPSRVIGLSDTPSPFQLLTLPKTGIESPKDMKGKRVAIVAFHNALIDAGSMAALRGYELALESVGLTLKDVEVVKVAITNPYGDFKSASGRDPSALWKLRRVGAREAVTPLLRGDADVVAVRGTFATDLGTIFGLKKIYDVMDHPDYVHAAHDAAPYALLASQALIDERPDLLHKFMVQLVRAAQWAKQHPLETIDVIARDLGHISETIRVTFGNDIGRTFDLNFDKKNVDALISHKSFLRRQNALKEDFEIEDWLAREPLARALAEVK